MRVRSKVTYPRFWNHVLLFILLLMTYSMAEKVSQRMPPLAFHHGRQALKRRRLQEAEAHFHEAIKLLPTFSGSYSGLGMVLVQKATAQRKEAYLHAAAEAFATSAKLDPNDASAWKNMATALTDLGFASNWSQAIDAYRRSQLIRIQRAVAYSNFVDCPSWEVISTWRNNEHVRIVEQEEDAIVEAWKSSVGKGKSPKMYVKSLRLEFGSKYRHHKKILVKHPFESSTRPYMIEMDNVELIGEGGLIVSRSACSIFTGTHSHLRTIPRQLAEHLSRPVMDNVDRSNVAPRVLSVITSTSASMNFFHWVTEDLVRLDVLLRHQNLWGENAVLLLPRGNLVNATMEILASRYKELFQGNMHVEPLRVAYYNPKLGFRASKLVMVDWDGPGAVTKKLLLETNHPKQAYSYSKLKADYLFPVRSRPPTSVYWAPRDGTLRAAHSVVAGLFGIKAGHPADIFKVDIPPEEYVLYCSRHNRGKKRVIFREDALIRKIETDLMLHVVVHSGMESFADQVRMFRSARAIIGPHGAGLSGMIFAKKEISPPVIVFALLGEREHGGYFGNLARSHGLSYYEVPSFRLWRTTNATLSDNNIKSVVETMGYAMRHSKCRER